MSSAQTSKQSSKHSPQTRQIVIVTAVLLTIAVGLLISTWRAGQNVTLVDAPHATLECASYTPSHDGHMLEVAEARQLVATDLKILAARFRCVRTYSVSEGLDEVPKIARELGLKVILGLWISSDQASNQKEVAHGIELANRYSDTVSAVVVGNEVLLRRDLNVEQLQQHMERVRSGTTVPVTYADVWEFWLRNPELANSANFVTVHILPYWEDNPIGIDHALDHVKNIYAKVQAAFPGKKILIGETGWPSSGRPRLTAIPSLVNEARFIREFVVYAENEKIPYNIIEAFDQPWKRSQEGTVGGFWGLYDAMGAAKFSFTGPTTARSNWRTELLIAFGSSLLFALSAWRLLTPRPSTRALMLIAVAGNAAGSIACAHWRYLIAANRTLLEWLATSTWAISGWALFFAASITLIGWLDGSAQVRRPASLNSLIGSLGHGMRASEQTSRILGVLRILMLACTAYVCLSLVYDGRGRDFPLALIALPTVGLALLELIARAANVGTNADTNDAKTKDNFSLDNEELLLALCFALSAFFIAWNETYVNLRAMSWCGLSLLLAGTLFTQHFRSSRSTSHPHQRAEQQPHTA